MSVLTNSQVPVVQRADNSIHRINHYPLDGFLCFVIIYPLDSDLSGGPRYPPFEQSGPEEQKMKLLIGVISGPTLLVGV